MKKKLKNLLLYAFIILGPNSCLSPIDLNVRGEQGLLVVEGLLTNEVKAHSIRLTRSIPLNRRDTLPESSALVWLEDDLGTQTYLNEESPGLYQSAEDFQGIIGRTYQLHIETQDGGQYLSSPELLRSVPPIDTIYAQFQGDIRSPQGGIYIYLDSQDPQSQTRFYRWEYEQTYQIEVPFPSVFKWLGGNEVVFRQDTVGLCWKTETSRDIIVNNTLNLSEDIIKQQLIKFIPAFSQELRIKYSIYAKQYALSEEAYFFLNLLNKLNQSQGSLFATQPGLVRGNIRSLNESSTPVLGYFFASQVQKKRAFFAPRDFRLEGYTPPPYFRNCINFTDTVRSDVIGEYMELGRNRDIKEIWEASGAGIVDFVVVPKDCANCTGFASNKKPDFWE